MTISNAGEVTILDDIFNAGTGFAIAANPYVALHTADPGETGANEATGGSYARQQTDFTAAAAGTLENVGAINFAGMPAGDIVAWSIWDAVTVGNCAWTGWFSTVSGLALVRAGADVTNNDVQSNAHGLVANDRVVFEVVEALSIPAGLTAGTLYFVIATGITTDSFRVSTTLGGAAVDITGAGSGLWRKVTVTTLGAGNTFQVPAGSLDVFLD